MLFLSVMVWAQAVSAEPWPIKEFEVVPAVPWQTVEIPGGKQLMQVEVLERQFRKLGIAPEALRVDWLTPYFRKMGIDTDEPYVADIPLTLEIKKQMEAYLKEVATELEAYGFPPPALKPVVDTLDGRRAYRIYYVSLTSARSRYEPTYDIHFLIDLPDPVIFLHDKNIVSSGKILDGGYNTMAHELFHAVQHATPFYRAHKKDNDPVGSWITEGQATAVGYDVTRRLRGGNRPEQFLAEKNSYWGLRDYSKPLVVTRQPGQNPPEIAYQTQSLWRYLAELDDARRPGGPYPPPGATPGTVDYRYLAYLLNRVPASTTPDGALAWLDSGLASYQRFGYGFHRTYADFISTFAAYGGKRGESGSIDRSEILTELWMVDGFGGPPLLELNPDQRKVTMPVRIEKVASQGFDVELSGFGNEVGVTVEVETSSLPLLNQLKVSMPGGQRVALPVANGIDPNTGKARTRWTFRMTDKSVGSNYLLISNIAGQAEKTSKQNFTLTVSIGGLAIDGAPADSASPQAPSPKQGNKKPSGASAQAKDRLQRATENIVTNGPLGQLLDRDEDDPYMTIHLQAMPDSFGVINEVNASGGMMAQLLASGELMNAAGVSGMMRGITDIVGAEKITLRIPRIDYGYTGTIVDAGLSVEIGTDPVLEARGPVDSDTTAFVEFLRSGRVTIDEYTPDFMSGSFAGNLIDLAANPRSSQERVVTANIVRSISGRFWVSSPWLADQRFHVVLADDTQREVKADIRQRLPSELAEVAEEAANEAADSAPDDDMDDLDEVARSAGCDCSCEGKRKLDLMRSSSGGEFTPEMFAMASCMSLCAASYMECR